MSTIKKARPVTPGRRGKVYLEYNEITTSKPFKKLTSGKKKISSRDNQGRISVRRRGGGHKRKYRIIDFKRDKFNVAGVVKSIEYDPNRNVFVSLVSYKDGEKRYILTTENMKVGFPVMSGESVKSEEGNALPLNKINIGSFVHNIEIKPSKGGQIVRSAGASARLLGLDGKYASVVLPSGETRRILGSCYATVGVLSNKEFKNIKWGKAGVSRWQGKRPKVRGVVMNPVDHPMGGGEGKTSGGRHPCSPTGMIAKGFKTRKPKKYSNQFITRRRKKK